MDEKTQIGYGERLGVQISLREKVANLAQSLAETKKLREQIFEDVEPAQKAKIQALYDVADEALIAAREDVAELRKQLAETEVTDNPWSHLDQVSKDIRKEADQSSVSNGDLAEVASDVPSEDPPVETVEKKPQPTELQGIEKRRQRDVDRKIAQIKAASPEDFLQMTRNELFAFLHQDSISHPQRAEAVRWLDSVLDPLVVKELANTGTALIKAYEERVKDPNNFPQVLRVNPTASQDDIQKAYRAMAQEYGMDKFAPLYKSEQYKPIWERLSRIFQQINQAYEVSKDNHRLFVDSAAAEPAETEKPKEAIDIDAELLQSLQSISRDLQGYFSGQYANRSSDMTNTARELFALFTRIVSDPNKKNTYDCYTRDNNSNMTLGLAASKETAEMFAQVINRYPRVRATVRQAGGAGESAYKIEIAVMWEDVEDTNPRQEAAASEQRGKQRQGSQSRERESSEIHSLEERLDSATSVSEILAILQRLVDLGHVWMATKNDRSVRRDPADIIKSIQKANQASRGKSAVDFERTLKEVSSIFDIRKKVEAELVPEFYVDVITSSEATFDQAFFALGRLLDVSYEIAVTTSRGQETRDPKAIIGSIKSVLENKDDPPKVHSNLSLVTSLGNLDVKLYKEVRSGWTWLQKMRNPIPSVYRHRYEALVV